MLIACYTSFSDLDMNITYEPAYRGDHSDYGSVCKAVVYEPQDFGILKGAAYTEEFTHGD